MPEEHLEKLKEILKSYDLRLKVSITIVLTGDYWTAILGNTENNPDRTLVRQFSSTIFPITSCPIFWTTARHPKLRFFDKFLLYILY